MTPAEALAELADLTRRLDAAERDGDPPVLSAAAALSRARALLRDSRRPDERELARLVSAAAGLVDDAERYVAEDDDGSDERADRAALLAKEERA